MSPNNNNNNKERSNIEFSVTDINKNKISTVARAIFFTFDEPPTN